MYCADTDSLEWRRGGKTYIIGDTGPAGGKVFYVTDCGFHGLEAADGDQGTGEWGCLGIITGATGIIIGTGADNTAAIVDENCGGMAAQLADDYELNGYTDWFLPSQDELHELFLNKDVVGGLDSLIYWSSTEYSSNLAWVENLRVGVGGLNAKFVDVHSVRAIRAF